MRKASWRSAANNGWTAFDLWSLMRTGAYQEQVGHQRASDRL